MGKTTAASPISFPRTPFAGVAILLLALNPGLRRVHAEEVAAVSNAAADTTLFGRAVNRAPVASPPNVTLERIQLASDDPALRLNGAAAYKRPLGELGGITYRWWVSRGASNFGVGVGAIGSMSLDAQAARARSVDFSASVLTLGWRYKVSDDSTLFADASSARRFSNIMPDRYTTKVGVEWSSKASRLGFDVGSRSLGLQLDSGYRMSFKLRRNGAGVYLRGQF